MIRYTELTENNREAFRDFLCNEIFERLDEDGVQAIGAFEETEEGETASAGVLVFSAKNDRETTATVHWLYVGASYRGQGIADGLMERMFDLLSFLGEYSLTCNIPEDPEYDDIYRFFEDWGFDFHRVELFGYTLYLEDMEKSPYYEKEGSFSRIVPLSDVSEEEWKRVRNRVSKQLHAKGGDRDRLLQILEADREQLDQVLSCAAEKKGEIEALYLWKAYSSGSSGLVEPVVLVDITGGNERLLLELLSYTAKKLKEEPPDKQLRVICRDGKVERLFKHLFPEERRDVSRRGVFSPENAGHSERKSSGPEN